jgi:hypothetical protein
MQILYNKGAKLNQMKMEKEGVVGNDKSNKKLKKVS